MIRIKTAINLHDILIERYSGTSGLRDRKALESALSRPFMTFDLKELYPTPVEKAAALIESIISNHPFIDGNKRLGYVLMRYFLLENKLDIVAGEDEKYDFVLKIAEGRFSFDKIHSWLLKRVINI